MPPLRHVSFSEPEHFFTLMVYLLVASINSNLGDRLRNQSSLERRRQRNTNLLYALCQQLMLTNNEKEYLRILAAKIIELTQAEVLILQEDGGSLRLLDDGLASLTLNETDWAAANWCWSRVRSRLANRYPAGGGL
jgi:two-component system sensor histidine kinase KdpD